MMMATLHSNGQERTEMAGGDTESKSGVKSLQKTQHDGATI